MNTSATFLALAEPNRLQIVELLREGSRSVSEIAELLGMRQPKVSQHLKILSRAGLVDVNPVAQRRLYKLRIKPFKEISKWVDSFDEEWNNRLDLLDSYVQSVHKNGNSR